MGGSSGLFWVETSPQHKTLAGVLSRCQDDGSPWIPQPGRPSCDLLLDHLHRHGGCNHVLLDGINVSELSLEDVPERGCFGYPSCSSALLLHARVLGHDWHFAHSLPLHRLDDHRSIADGRVLPDPLRGESETRRWHVLAFAPWHYSHVGLRLLW